MTTPHHPTVPTTAPHPAPHAPHPAPTGGRAGRGALGTAIGLALTVVIVAPLALSSGDLMRWAGSPQGLGLDPKSLWPVLVFIALDAAAAVCVGLVVYAAWRGERGGIFHLLVWVFAGGSAFANYQHGESTPAPDDVWFFPAMSLVGPLLLEATVSRIRRWVRTSAGHYAAPLPHFGLLRWLPGIAHSETREAWRTAIRHGLSSPADALAFVRERDALAGLSPVDALRYAFAALGTWDTHAARVWLAARGVIVDQGAIDAATAGRPQSPIPAAPVSPAAPPVPVSAPPVRPSIGEDTAALAVLTKADSVRHAFSVLGEFDVPGAVRWLGERGIKVDRSYAYEISRKAQEPHLQVVNGTAVGTR